jgi:hypothetical protein
MKSEFLATELAYKNGFAAGKEAVVDEIIDRIKANQGLNVQGIPHYIVTDHQLAVIKKLVLEKKDED